MRVIVAYDARGCGLPVAVEDTCAAMSRRLGLHRQELYRLLRGQRAMSKMNAMEIPLVVRYVEIGEEENER